MTFAAPPLCGRRFPRWFSGWRQSLPKAKPYIHKPQGAPDYALPDLPYAFRSLDDYEFIDMEDTEHESEQEESLETDGAE